MGSSLVIIALTVAGLGAGFALRPLVAKHDAPVTTSLPILEVVTSALFALAAWRFGGSWRVVPVLALIMTLVAISVVDLRRYRIPNAILFPALGICAAMLVVGELVDGSFSNLTRAALGAVLYFLVLFIAHIASPSGMGFGDVKLAILLGLFVGWVAEGKLKTVSAVLVALFIGSLLGLVVGMVLVLLRKVGVAALPDPDRSSTGPRVGTSFPFGPPLAAATLLLVLFPATFAI